MFFFIIFKKHFSVSITAPNRRPGNVSWKTDGLWVTVRWGHVKAMHNESAVLGYKVSPVCLKVCICVFSKRVLSGSAIHRC